MQQTAPIHASKCELHLLAFGLVRSLSRLSIDQSDEAREQMQNILQERDRVRAERLAESK